MKFKRLRGAALTCSSALAALAWPAVAAAASLPSTIPYKTPTPADDGLIYRAVAAFLLACLAAYGVAWCIKRYLPAIGKSMGIGKQLERLEVIRLNQRSVLVRVRWHDEELLIGENEHSVALLGRRLLRPGAATDAAKVPPEAAVEAKDIHD